MFNAKAYSATSPKSPLAATRIQRRDPTPHDVQIEILFCGICHSDLHQARNEWSGMPTVYPCVPGHEIVGRVAKVGSAVTSFEPGDLAGVGCLVDSDGTCPECRSHHEQFCPSAVYTYNAPDEHTGKVTYGGYSDSIVVDERFVRGRYVLGMLAPKAAPPALLGSLGLVMFVYGIGIQYGKQFFGGLTSPFGLKVNALALASHLVALGICYLAHAFFSVAPAHVAGLFAGALTSTKTRRASHARRSAG